MAGKICSFEKEHGITIKKDNVVSKGLEIALQVEKRDQLVYAEAAAQTKNYQLKELFTMLATEEQHHISELLALKDCLKASGRWTEFKPKTTGKLRLPPSVASPAGKAASSLDEVEVIIAAMKSEKESEAFYRKLAVNAPSKSARDFFMQIAETEGAHYELLDKLFQEIEDSAVKLRQ